MEMIVQKVNTDPKYLNLFKECYEDIRWAEQQAFSKGLNIFRVEATRILKEQRMETVFLMKDHDIRLFLADKECWGWRDTLTVETVAVISGHGLFSTRFRPTPDGLCAEAYMDMDTLNYNLQPHSVHQCLSLAQLLENLEKGWYVKSIPLIPHAEK